MSNYLPGNSRNRTDVDASPALAKRRFGAKWGKVAEGSKFPRWRCRNITLAKMPQVQLCHSKSMAEVLPPIPSEY